MARRLHEETEIGLRTVSEVACGQLAEAQLKLKKARVEAKVSMLRAESVTVEIEITRAWIQELQTALEARAQSEKEVRSFFLLSPEFKWVVSNKAYIYFETDFYRCRDQFEEAGLIPTDREDFPSFGRAIVTLPDNEDEQQLGETNAEVPWPNDIL